MGKGQRSVEYGVRDGNVCIGNYLENKRGWFNLLTTADFETYHTVRIRDLH